MPLKTTEQIPIEYPTYERIERLKSAGIETDGQIDELISLMAQNALKLPIECKEGFKFELIDETGKFYTFIYINLVDACAEKLLKIFEKNGKTKI